MARQSDHPQQAGSVTRAVADRETFQWWSMEIRIALADLRFHSFQREGAMLHARIPGFLHPRTTSVRPPGRRPATRRRTSLVATCGAVALAVVAALTATADAAAVGHHAHVGAGPAAAKPAAKQSGPLFVHDPSMAMEKGTYYLFSTGDPAGTLGNGNIQIRTSPNLKDWTYTGTVFATNPLGSPTPWATSPTCGHPTSPSSTAFGTSTTRARASARTTR